MKKLVHRFIAVFSAILFMMGMLCITDMPQVKAAEKIPVFQISMDKTKIKAGDEVEVTLTLKEGADLSSFMVTLPYDSSKLICEKITNGNLEEKGLLESADVDGNIRAGYMGTKGLNESTEVLSVRFRVADNANASELKFTPQFSDFVFGYGDNETELDSPSADQVKTEGATGVSIVTEGNTQTAGDEKAPSESEKITNEEDTEKLEQSGKDNDQNVTKQEETKESTNSNVTKKTETSEEVKTGDESPILAYAVVGIVALGVIVGLGVVTYRKKRTSN